jgi:hypothetical protein
MTSTTGPLAESSALAVAGIDEDSFVAIGEKLIPDGHGS